MKKIHVTHIDTGGHGYYSVSKKDILLLGIKNAITRFSGHNLTRVYLEEDQDGILLYNAAKAIGYEIICKSGYNLKFNITHNYNAGYFSWQPIINDVVYIHEKRYVISHIDAKRIIVVNENDTAYKIPLSNPFKYINI